MPLPLFLATGAALAVGILLVFVGLAGARPVDPVQARLTQLGAGQVHTLEELELQQPLFERTLKPLANRLSGAARRLTSPAQANRTERKLAMAGNPLDLRTPEFLGLKATSAIAVFLGFFVLFGLLGSNLSFGIIGGLPVGALGFFLPDYWLSRRVRARRKGILLAIPDTLDLLTISVRAGLGFDAALAKVVEKTSGPLSDEFRRALAEIRLGKTRRETLRDIIARTDVPALTNFIGAIIQAEQLGVSISKVLQVQSEQLRIERRQRAEEMAAKAPIKMLFPLVGCIFPSLFIIILGPAIILIMTQLKT